VRHMVQSHLSLPGAAGVYQTKVHSQFGLPAGLTISGFTLSGTPTQGGFFDILTSVQDAICPAGGANEQLHIVGNVASSITVLSGDGQSTPPGTKFPLPIKVAIRDDQNKPLSGVAVIFNAPVASTPAPIPTGTLDVSMK